MARDRELRQLTRRQVAHLLEQAIQPSNTIAVTLNGLWRECADAREVDVVKRELRGIVATVRTRSP